MSRYENRIEIEGTPDEVFAVLSTPRLMPRYSPMLRAEALPTGQVKQGDAFSNHFGPQGRGARLSWRVEESDSPNLLVYTGSGPGGLRFKASNRIMSTGKGSTMLIAEMEYEPPYGKAGQVVDRTLAERFGKAEHRQAIRNLKDLIEGIHGSLSSSIAA
jgi:ligand-binding SRPBCC domain-containing protein